MDHVEQTIETYNKIASEYHLASTPENRAWLEGSMREFFVRLPGCSILVVGCGEGRDSRFLRDLGGCIVSLDLSEGMLAVARAADPKGTYLQCDLRNVRSMRETFDGIWACACLYHLTKKEFRACLADFRRLLNQQGILFLNLKLGVGEGFIDVPRDGYPGGKAAKEKLAGSRYFAFYRREELNDYFSDFVVEKEGRNHLKEGEGAMEFWLRRR